SRRVLRRGRRSRRGRREEGEGFTAGDAGKKTGVIEFDSCPCPCPCPCPSPILRRAHRGEPREEEKSSPRRTKRTQRRRRRIDRGGRREEDRSDRTRFVPVPVPVAGKGFGFSNGLTAECRQKKRRVQRRGRR